jgi:anion-transporting  ArsA/GET3 family ATPase
MSGLLARGLVVVTGKGGVGKTTVAAALGMLAAGRGMRAVVAECGGRRDAARLLAGSAVDHVAIEPHAAMEEYLHDQLPSGAVAELLARSGAFSALAAATPGLPELLTVGKAWELTLDPRRDPGERPYDVVVLDAPSSGHALAMLAAPRSFSEAARVGPVHRQAERIDAALRDPERTAVVAVATPEEMPVAETLELRDALPRRIGRALDAVVVNAVAPDRFAPAEAVRLATLEQTPAVRAALWAHRRARAQRVQLRALRAGLGAAPAELPYLFSGALEPDGVRALAGALKALA